MFGLAKFSFSESYIHINNLIYKNKYKVIYFKNVFYRDVVSKIFNVMCFKKIEINALYDWY